MSETIIVIIFFLILLISPIIRKRLVAFFKGRKGEFQVRLRLRMLPTKKYKVINNLLICQNGHTSQIDHVVVSEYGIFVIETKNYKGYIYGGLDSEYWTQNIYGKKFKLFNPLLQNQSHVKAIGRLLPDIHPDFLVSIVAFSRRATLKKLHFDNVIYWNRVNRFIRSYSQKRISSEQVQKAFSTLTELNSTSGETRNKHLKKVRNEIYRRHVSVNNGFCPRCGGRLVMRLGKHGKFYGCSNYPRCRFTHKS